MQELLDALEKAKVEVKRLELLLQSVSDGYKYVSVLRCYGSVTHVVHNNQYTVQLLCDEYNGDNGIVDIYTTNPSHTIDNYSGSTIFCNENEILEISLMNDISMMDAVCNRLTGW